MYGDLRNKKVPTQKQNCENENFEIEKPGQPRHSKCGDKKNSRSFVMIFSYLITRFMSQVHVSERVELIIRTSIISEQFQITDVRT